MINLDVERQIIGSLITGDVSRMDEIKVDYFGKDTHKELVLACKTLNNKNKNIDIITLTDEICKYSENVEEIQKDIQKAMEVHEYRGVNDHYLGILVNYYKRRKLLNALQEGIKNVGDLKINIDGINSDIANMIDKLSFDTEEDTDDMCFVIDSTMKDLKESYDKEKVKQYEYGLGTLDWYMSGLHNEELTTIAARSSVGKTAFALQIAKHNAKNGLNPLIVSREMSAEQLMKRMLSNESFIDSTKFRNKSFTKDEWESIEAVAQDLRKLKMNISTKTETITDIKKKLRKSKNGILYVDYVQLMTPEIKGGSREREVAAITRDLKSISSKFEIPVVQLSQLNDKAGDCRPSGERDMRESAAIFQDSSNVVFIHKPNEKEQLQYEKTRKVNDIDEFETDKERIVECIVAKQRDGRTGSFLLNFRKKDLRFYERS